MNKQKVKVKQSKALAKILKSIYGKDFLRQSKTK